MSPTPSFPQRALSVVATIALTVAGVTAIAVAPAAAATSLVYDSIPEASVPSYPSIGFQATSTDEVGSWVQLDGTDRVLTDVTVGLTNWSCENWETISPPTVPCATTPGSGFAHDITLNLYEVDDTGALPAPGALIASVTESKQIPYRPSASAECTGANAGKWWDVTTATCNNGFAFTVTFDLSAQSLVVGDDLMVGVAFNTQTHGANPLGVAGPYNSLNVSIATQAPTVGHPENDDEMLVDSTWAGNYTDGGAGGLDVLRTDTGWTGYHGLVLEIGADNSTVPGPANDVTVYQKDVKPTENSSTYQSWHEGKNNATPAYSVHPDGLHLGDGASSTIIKGTDVATSEVTKAELRALILAGASVNVVSASNSTLRPTFQLPIAFGSALTPGNYTFTTLQTSLDVGANGFTLGQDWRTSRAFGPYPSPQSTDTLGGFLDTVFESDHVWLFGFGVQADASAVIDEVVWDDTRYTFFQPEIEPCTPDAGATITNLDANGWTFGETRSQGTNEFTSAGLHVSTYGAAGSPDPRKAAGYHPIDIALADIGTVGIEFAPGFTGTRPSLQLGFDKDGNGTWDGYLVGEPWYYGGGTWSPSTNGDWDDAKFWANPDFGVGAGGGYTSMGTLAQYLLANPNARIVSYGYSLGSGVIGDATITSITVGCSTTSFSTATPPAAASTVSVNDHDIRPNEATYAGWHEGHANSSRAYSVKSDGLHLGDGHVSQILYGLPTPLVTTDLESIITGASLDVSSGSVSFQVPITYGPTNKFTTLRSLSLSTTGVRGVSVTDAWVTTRAIYAADGTTVLLPAQSQRPLADFVALLGSIGNVTVQGYAVQADTSAVVKSLTVAGTKYVFTPYVAPSVTSTVRVPEASIALDETVYTGWHEGYTNATKSFSVHEDGLHLGSPLHSQILNGFASALTSPAIDLLIAGASVTVESGSVTYQVPIYYGSGSDFTTLRSESLGVGSHTFDLQSAWASSRDIPSLSIVAHQLYPLGDLLDKLTNVRVLGVGVQADAAAEVSALVFNQVEYRFDGPIVAGAPTIAGTPSVGQTLTAQPGTWAPPGVTFTYQWKSNGSPISGATSSTYPLTADEAGDTIVVVVTGHLDGYANVSATSPGVSIALGSLTTATPTILGTADIGSTLTASPGTWGPAPVALSYQWLSDGAPITGATNVTYLITLADAGHALSVTVTGSKTGYTSASVTSAPTITLPTDAVPAVDRIFGADRYATAVEVAQGFEPGVSRVYIATGQNYPDALSAAPAAAHFDSPLLLTLPDGLPSIVRTELLRLHPAEIIIVGGSSVVSDTVRSQLQALAFHPTVTRIAGDDRFETSRLIAAESFDSATTAYVATGLNFPDALAAAPAAAHFDGPVILVNGQAGSVDIDTLQTLLDLGVDNVKIAGTQLVVSTGISSQLGGLFSVTRNGGANRFETAVEINDDEFTSSTEIYLATGLNFPDALSGAARAGVEGAPLFIVPSTCIPESTFEAFTALHPAHVTLLGGTAALSVDVENLVVCG